MPASLQAFLAPKTAAGRRPPRSIMKRMEPELAEYSSDGVDLTLIRWMLEMTPAERLETLQSFIDSISELRGEYEEG